MDTLVKFITWKLGKAVSPQDQRCHEKDYRQSSHPVTSG